MSLDLQAIRERAKRRLFNGHATHAEEDRAALIAEVERLNAEVDSQARQIAARSGEPTWERLFKELATAKQADLTKAEARLDRVRAVRDYIDVRKDWPAPRWVLLERLDRALDGEATEEKAARAKRRDEIVVKFGFAGAAYRDMSPSTKRLIDYAIDIENKLKKEHQK